MRSLCLLSLAFLAGCLDRLPTAARPATRPAPEIFYVGGPLYDGPVDPLSAVFSTMQPGDSVAVSFATRGCFHAAGGRLAFRHTGLVVQAMNGADPSRAPAIILGGKELLALDRELMWRRRSERLSTTSETVLLEVWRGGVAVRREKVVSESYPPLRIVDGIVDNGPSYFSRRTIPTLVRDAHAIRSLYTPAPP